MVLEAHGSQRTQIRQPATVNGEVQILQHMFWKAMEWDKTLDNLVSHQKPLRANNRRLHYLSHEEIGRLLSATDERRRPLLAIALHTGLRRSELFALNWQYVDMRQEVKGQASTGMHINDLRHGKGLEGTDAQLFDRDGPVDRLEAVHHDTARGLRTS